MEYQGRGEKSTFHVYSREISESCSLDNSQSKIFHIKIFQREVPSNPNPGILKLVVNNGEHIKHKITCCSKMKDGSESGKQES